MYEACERIAFGKFYRHEGYLFKMSKLYISQCSIYELLMRETHRVGHFGVKKTLNMLNGHFFWPYIKRDVEHIYARCTKCKQAKSKIIPHRLYIPLDVPNKP